MQDGRPTVLVHDTGCGIQEDKWQAIFEPFAQADGSLTRPGEGMGLGLSISRQLARDMGGDLTVTSVVGEGCTFSLPLAPTSGRPETMLKDLNTLVVARKDEDLARAARAR